MSQKVRFHQLVLAIPQKGFIHLLTLKRAPSRCTPEIEVLSITGGLLVRKAARTEGRFEFRRIRGERDTVLIVLQNYAPSLPWYLYETTQAIAHLLVMRCFRWWLKRRFKTEQAVAAG